MFPISIGQATWAGSQFPNGYVATLQDSNNIAGSGFTQRLAMSGAGDIIVSGDNSETVSGVSLAGAAYIFEPTSGVWPAYETTRLVASDVTTNATFGGWVSISRDGAILAVSAATRPSTATSAGAVYMFKKVTGVWTQQQLIVSPAPTINGRFGTTTALSADGNTLVSSAPFLTVSAVVNVGAVYVYGFAAGSWSLQTTIPSPVSSASVLFGQTLAVSDDGLTIAVGMQGVFATTPTFPISIYSKATGSWVLIQSIDAPYSVSTQQHRVIDLSADGQVLLLSAANDGSGYGVALVYERLGKPTFTLTTTITDPLGNVSGSLFANGGAMNPTGEFCTLFGATDVVTGDTRSYAHLYSRLGDSSWALQETMQSTVDAPITVRSNYAVSSDATLLAFPGGLGTNFVIQVYQDVPQINGYLGQSGGRTRTVTTSLIAGAAIPDWATALGQTLGISVSLIAGAASGASAGTTVLLMHFNGTNGAASYIDSSASPLTITEATGFGENLLSTSSPKLGSACLRSNTPNGDMLYTPQGTTSKLNLGTGPFNIQCFVKLTSGHGSVFFYRSALFTNFFNLIITNTNRLAMQCPGGNTTFSTTTLFTPGIWQHLEVSRDASGVIRGFIEGTLLGTTRTYTGDLSATSADFWFFGGSDGSTTTDWDELRVVVGDAVHTASFTPPTTELT